MSFDISYGSLYLRHYGVKGQEWGIRNGPPYPLDKKTKPKSIDIYKYKDGKKYLSAYDYLSKSYKDVEIDHKTNPRKFDSIKDHVYDILLLIGDNPSVLNPIISRRNEKRVLNMLAGRSNENYDEKTGLYLKNNDISEFDDIKNVNPYYDTLLPGSRSNCMLCSMTMEMRKRGYDVSAKRETSGYYGEEIARFFPGAKSKLAGLRSEFDSLNSYIDSSVNMIMKNPNGSHGEIGISWSGGTDDEMFGDHSMYWEIKDDPPDEEVNNNWRISIQASSIITI